VSARSENPGVEGVDRGQAGTILKVTDTRRVVRIDMEGDHRIDTGQRTVSNHGCGTTQPFAVEALFRGLEEQADITLPGVPVVEEIALQQSCHPQQHGRVRIVPAGMHHARVF